MMPVDSHEFRSQIGFLLCICMQISLQAKNLRDPCSCFCFEALRTFNSSYVNSISMFADPVMHNCIEKTLYSGHATYKVSLSVRTFMSF